tara:strand:- start:216 stop:446 length:231 start_codon:yes stop_codon:yes gene_type:complete
MLYNNNVRQNNITKQDNNMKNTFHISLVNKTTKTQVFTTIKCDSRDTAKRIVKREVGNKYKIIGIRKTIMTALWEE